MRRRRAHVPLAWADRLRHAMFVGVISVMALSPGGLPQKIGVLGLALAYALSLASDRPPRREAATELLDEEGISQVIGGQTVRVPWEDVASYRVTPYSMGGIGLHGADGRLLMILGKSLEENGGSVTWALWNRLGRQVAKRVAYDGAHEDPRWRSHVRMARWRLAAGVTGVGLCLSPIFMRTLLRVSEHQVTLLASFFLILLVAVCLFVLGIGVASASESAEFGSETDAGSPTLSEFLDVRSGDLIPTALELGVRYRYLETAETIGGISTGGFSLPHVLYVGLMQAGLLLRIEWVMALATGCCLLPISSEAFRWWHLHRLSRGRNTEFAIEDGDLIVTKKGKQDRYPLTTARLLSVNRSWFDFGGEVEEYRNGPHRVLIDRRFLVPIHPEAPTEK